MTEPIEPEKCSVPICDLPTKSRGWCTAHYERWRRTGDVRANEPLRAPQARTHPCGVCNAPVRLYRTYCSVECAFIARTGRPQIGSSIITCGWCYSEFIVPACRAGLAKFCSILCRSAFDKVNGPKGSEHHSWNRVAIVCDTCKTIFEVRKSRATTAKYCSGSCAAIGKLKIHSRISSIEATVAIELERRRLLYDAQVRVGKFVSDFIVGDTIIEVDGDYWHNLPEAKERDPRKDAFYEANGFHVIRIWEHEVNASDFSKLDVLQVV